jgi:hypothetical protein
MRLSRLESVILCIPVLGTFDVLSTFFADWRGYPIDMYETGLFASYFSRRGLLPVYVLAYLGILSGIAALLILIKRDVSKGFFLDGLVLLLLVTSVGLIEGVLTSVVVSNSMIALGKLMPSLLRWLIYLSVFAVILSYTWDELKELFGFGAYDEE